MAVRTRAQGSLGLAGCEGLVASPDFQYKKMAAGDIGRKEQSTTGVGMCGR